MCRGIYNRLAVVQGVEKKSNLHMNVDIVVTVG